MANKTKPQTQDLPQRGNGGNQNANRQVDEQHGQRGTQLSPNHTNGSKDGKKK